MLIFKQIGLLHSLFPNIKLTRHRVKYTSMNGLKKCNERKRENMFIRFIVDIYLFSRDMKVFTDPYLTVVVGKFEHMCVRAVLQYLQAVGQKKKK